MKGRIDMSRRTSRMNRRIPSLAAAAALIFAACGSQAQAQQQKEYTVFVGGIHLDVHTSGDPLSFNPPRELPGDAGIHAGNASTVLFGAIWRFRPSWSAELVLGIPPKHKAYGSGVLEPFGQVGSFRQVAPTAFLNYHPGPWGRFDPFVGAGINYTRFTHVRSTASGDLANGGPTEFKLSDSWGPAVHVGTTVALDKGWSLLASVSYLRGRSDVTATARLADGSTSVGSTKVKFGQVGTTLALAYSF
jgi:outer membrane protein